MTKLSDPFTQLPLSRSDFDANPIIQFKKWFEDAHQEFDRTAMTLATVDRAYQVTARMVLLKSVEEQGFVFFTNYESLKAKQIKEVAQAALVFWWPTCQRQVRITGLIEFVAPAQSDTYFNQRPLGSRIAAIISQQSMPIPNRQYLIDKYDALAKQSHFERPDYWGGYIVKPTSIEFWQGRDNRLHDRFLYSQKNQHWEIQQLSP